MSSHALISVGVVLFSYDLWLVACRRNRLRTIALASIVCTTSPRWFVVTFAQTNDAVARP